MSRTIDKDVHEAVQVAILDKLRELGVDVDGNDCAAAVLILIEPRPQGEVLHLGSFNLSDEDVLQVLAEAPSCVVRTLARELAGRGSA